MEENKKATGSHFLRNFLIIFAAAVLLLGTVLGTVTVITNAKTYARYSGTVADKATYSYLASYYKLNFMRAFFTEDKEETDSFWDSKPEGSEKTYQTLLEEGTKNYISHILVSAALYDSAATAAEKKAAKEAAKNAAEEILTYRAKGDKAAFNEMTAPYGYTYADLKDIALLLYKAANAQSLFYGIGGANVTSRLDDCNAYLSDRYSAVYLFFIRTESTYTYTVDENGSKVINVGDDGAYVTRKLTDEEIAGRRETVARIDAAIAEDQMTPAFLRAEMEAHYSKAPEGKSSLYYFSDNAAYTQRFSLANGEAIVAAAKDLSVGECQKVSYKHGVCYVYKSTVEENAFGVRDYENYFSDFYQNAADYLFAEDIGILLEDVVFKKRASDISPTALPYKNIIPVRF